MSRCRAVFSLGSNLPDRLGHLRAGVGTLRRSPLIEVTEISSVYETDAVGGPADNPDFLNLIVLADTYASPDDLLELAQRAERLEQRTREVRHGPRTLDVDLIAVGDIRRDEPRLTLPHPRAHLRGFVLVPWLEVDPAAVLPSRGPVVDLLNRIDSGGVRRRDELSADDRDYPSAEGERGRTGGIDQTHGRP